MNIDLSKAYAVINKEEGEAIVYTAQDFIVLNTEDVRRLYYAVLGIQMPDTTIKEQITNQRATSTISVDVPEDILLVEKIIDEMKKRLKGYLKDDRD